LLPDKRIQLSFPIVAPKLKKILSFELITELEHAIERKDSPFSINKTKVRALLFSRAMLAHGLQILQKSLFMLYHEGILLHLCFYLPAESQDLAFQESVYLNC